MLQKTPTSNSRHFYQPQGTTCLVIIPSLSLPPPVSATTNLFSVSIHLSILEFHKNKIYVF